MPWRIRRRLLLVVSLLAMIGCSRRPSTVLAPHAIPSGKSERQDFGTWQTAIKPIEWLPENSSFDAEFGGAVAYDGESLFVGGAARKPGMLSGIYVFATVRDGMDVATELRWRGRYVVRGGRTRIGQRVVACNRGFVATTEVGVGLWFQQVHGEWKLTQRIAETARDLGSEVLACTDRRAVFACGKEAREACFFDLKDGSWFLRGRVALTSRALSATLHASVAAIGGKDQVEIIDSGSLVRVSSLAVPGNVWAVAMNERYIFVASNAVGQNVIAFRLVDGDWKWAYELPDTEVAVELKLSGPVLLAGSSSADSHYPEKGEVAVFHDSGTMWRRVGLIFPGRIPSSEALFGSSLDLSHGDLVVAAPGMSRAPPAVYLIDLTLVEAAHRNEETWESIAHKWVSPVFYQGFVPGGGGQPF